MPAGKRAMRRRSSIVYAAAAAMIIVTAAAYVLLSRGCAGVRRETVSAADAPYRGITVDLVCGRPVCDTIRMGVVHPSQIAARRIRFVNTTDRPIALADYRTTCGCTTIRLPQRALAPGEHADAECRFDAGGLYSYQLNVLEIVASEPGVSVTLLVEAEVE